MHCFRHGCPSFHQPPGTLLEDLQKLVLVRWTLSALKGIDRVLAPSAYMRDQLRLNGIPDSRLEILPPFLQTGLGTPALPSRSRLILYAGRVDETKGIRPFLHSLARIPQIPWDAEVAGDGPQLESARALARELGIADRVRFLGQLPAEILGNRLSQARLFVMPSLAPESFGLSGLEALASGLPVVAFDSGGIAEWLQDGAGGYRVPRGDIAAMAQRIGQLLQDDKLADHLGRLGRQLATRFDRNQHLARLGSIYSKLVRLQTTF